MSTGISSLVSANASAASKAKASDSQQIAGNFTQFLTLLTTQLKNQNPLDPMDTNQFTQQLVQFASVEQQLKANDRLDSIVAASKASSTATATGYLGRTITADGATAELKSGAAAWNLTAPRAASRATVTILDASGNTVATQQTTLKAGSQTYTWNGRNAAGMSAPEGTYTIKVAASDATGASVAITTAMSGTVDEVDLSGSAPVLLVGSQRVPLASVTGVALSTTTP